MLWQCSDGEPDFDTPDHGQRGRDSSDRCRVYQIHTCSREFLNSKRQSAQSSKKTMTLNISRPQILVSCGAKHSIYNAVQVLCDEGDEVLIPAPYWVSHPEMVNLAGGRPVILSTTIDKGFKSYRRRY